MIELLIVSGLYILTLGSVLFFLPRMPEGYDTEWEPSAYDKWRNK